MFLKFSIWTADFFLHWPNMSKTFKFMFAESFYFLSKPWIFITIFSNISVTATSRKWLPLKWTETVLLEWTPTTWGPFSQIGQKQYKLDINRAYCLSQFSSNIPQHNKRNMSWFSLLFYTEPIWDTIIWLLFGILAYPIVPCEVAIELALAIILLQLFISYCLTSKLISLGQHLF